MTLGRTAPQGFPKSNRLLSKKDFDAVFDNGLKVVCRDFVIVASSKSTGMWRLGLVVSKKVGNAVVRNRVKRCVRDTFRTMGPQDLIERDVVVIARSSLVSEDGRVKRDVKASLTGCLSRVRGQIQRRDTLKQKATGNTAREES